VAPAVYSPVGFTATVVPTCYPTTVNYFTSPVRLGGDWTYNQYNPWTRTHNQVVDVGLTASGQAPITYTNATGGWTMLKSMGRR
jgi:hypothetical protein